MIRFWKALGVKGFRFDVVNLISSRRCLWTTLKGDGRRFYTDGPRVHEYLRELVTDTGIEDMVTVGEMSSTSWTTVSATRGLRARGAGNGVQLPPSEGGLPGWR